MKTAPSGFVCSVMDWRRLLDQETSHIGVESIGAPLRTRLTEQLPAPDRPSRKTCRGFSIQTTLDVDGFLTTRLPWTGTVITKIKEGYEHDG